MSTNAIERYLTDMAEIHGTKSNSPETSFYPALETLLNEIGKGLSPKVRCVTNLANRGAGLPDGGLFTIEQFARNSHSPSYEKDPFGGQNPSRGVIEAKPLKDDVENISVTDQIERYWKKYGMVLVTNFRSFMLIGKDTSGKPSVLESFYLAKSEKEFWRLADHPRKTAAERGDRMLEYLHRVLLHNAPLTAPQDVAAILASYAHESRLHIEQVDLPALTGLRQALENSLGIQFEGPKGEHFFRSTLVQTLFYGIFSAWVLWSRGNMPKPVKKTDFADALREKAAPYNLSGPFDWRLAHTLLRVPMLRALFLQVADSDRLGELGLVEILNWTAATLNRVDRTEFFRSFDEGHAVQYFYEPFLEAFDPDLRKELGVWYTPEEIVRYQVEQVDAVLRSELGLRDGFADPKVVVLDPCCGTGAYLRAVLRRIATTLHEKGGDALIANDLKKAAIERVFGFEILPAPFVIAHLQIGLELETLGAPLSNKGDSPERAGVYLTNSLTGWEPPKEKPKQITFPGFSEERDAADKVKQEKPILVILGNPPYNAFAGVSPEEEEGLVEPYKKGLISDWGIKKFNLDDLYIRFFRLSEKRVAEKGGRGVISFISNFSYLSDPSFVVMRKRFFDEFDNAWFDCLNGDSRETGKLTPKGKPDPSVFSTEWNHEGIRVGTTISLFVKTGLKNVENEIKPIESRSKKLNFQFRQFWGVNKRAELLDSLEKKDFKNKYEKINPSEKNRWSFRPSDVTKSYLEWPKLIDIADSTPFVGLEECRGGDLIDFEHETLAHRIKRYLNPSIELEKLKDELPKLTTNSVGFNSDSARKKLLQQEPFNEKNIRPYLLRPFDKRWCYYSMVSPLWNRPRPTLEYQCRSKELMIISRSNCQTKPEGACLYITSSLFDKQTISRNPGAFPILVRVGDDDQTVQLSLGEQTQKWKSNLSSGSKKYLSSIGFADFDSEKRTAKLIWFHALAIGYSPEYLSKNQDGIHRDWPRIPLPKEKEKLKQSSELGEEISRLLDTDTAIEGLTSGKIREGIKEMAVFRRVDGKPAKPEKGDLDLTAGWGHSGKGGITMPGKGKIVLRDNGSYDIYLNETSCWQNVPRSVWDYSIGGYQVIKKWLSYHEKSLLGRGLTVEEVRYVTDISRRLASLVALQPELDINYRDVSKSTYTWPG